MNAPDSIEPLVVEAAELLREQHWTLATVESCTGGMVGATLTALAGISDVYLGGFVTYSNMAKQTAVGVRPQTLAKHGAVSGQVAREMAGGGRRKLLATHALAITGIAGPDGGTDDKSIGTVWICTAGCAQIDCRRFVFPGDRASVRLLATFAALSMLIQQITGRYEELDYQHEQSEA
jgi:nicotinamide-nucleotide amidase